MSTEPLHVQGEGEQTAPLVTTVIGLKIAMPAIAATNRYVLIIQAPDHRIVTVHDDGTVTLGDGVTLDEASRAFWERVQFEGKTLYARCEAAEQGAEAAKLYEDAYYAMRSYLQSSPYMAPEIREGRFRVVMNGIAETDRRVAELEAGGQDGTD